MLRYGSFVLLLLSCTGCGSDGPRVVRVTGTVTRGGQPVEKLVVNFMPEQGRPSWGQTDAEGKYKLGYTHDRDGAVAGMHKVWVEVRPATPAEEIALRNGTLPLHPQMDSILVKYGNRNQPALTVEVKEDNQVVDLKLD